MEKSIEEIRQEINLDTICVFLGVDKSKNIEEQVDYILKESDSIFENDIYLRSINKTFGFLYQNTIIHLCNLLLFYTMNVDDEEVDGEFDEENTLRSVYPLGFYFDNNIEPDSDTRPLKDYLGYKYKFKYYLNYLRNIELINLPITQEDYVINGLIYQRRKEFSKAEEMYKKASAEEALINLDYVQRTGYPEIKYLNHNDKNYYLVSNPNDTKMLYILGVENYYGIGRVMNKELGLSYLAKASKLGSHEAKLKLKEIKKHK